MANICFDSVIFYLDDETDNSALCRLSNDLKVCYPSLTPTSNDWIGALLHHLHIPTSSLYLRGNIESIQFSETWLRLDLAAAWNPLLGVYKALAEHYGLLFVLQSEEPGEGIFINTDTTGRFLDTRYHILLYNENDPTGTSYEKLFRNQTDADFYFSTAKAVLAWFSLYGIRAANLDILMQRLNSDFVHLDVYDLTYEKISF